MTRPASGARGGRRAVALVSLGCAKNTVDSECLLGNLARAGLVLAEDPADADVCLVNTCGFIQDAREETADVLKELASLKQNGQLKAIVALGCLVERVAEWPDFAEFLRHADRRIGFAEYPRLPDICRSLAATAAAPASAPASVSARGLAAGDFDHAAVASVNAAAWSATSMSAP